MKRNIALGIFLFFTNLLYAQNPNEAKMAFQLAEEKFVEKKYNEALNLLQKSELAFGRINPPIAYLRVIITDQLVLSVQDKDEAIEALDQLEKALQLYDQTSGLKELSEEKQMEVYRIKNDFGKRKEMIVAAYYQRHAILNKFRKMIYRLGQQFPSTETTVSDFMDSWKERNWEGPSFSKRSIDLVIKRGSSSFVDYLTTENQFALKDLETYGEGRDKVKIYYAIKLLNTKKYKTNYPKRMLSVAEICGFLGIDEESWIDFTTGSQPLIVLDKNHYKISTDLDPFFQMKNEYFFMAIYKYLYRDTRHECYFGIINGLKTAK